MATLSTGKVLKYTLLPGFLPRLHAFFATGFMHVAYMIAIVYHSVRLLPDGHPYLNPANIGRYGMRHVIAEAANNLVFARRNIDQIIVFFAILAGAIMLMLQVVLLVMAVLAPAAMAGIAPADVTLNNILGVESIFGHGSNLGNGEQDIAFIILDRVFGLGSRVYGSCISLQLPCMGLNGQQIGNIGGPYPWPMHRALHTLFHYYSIGIFMVGVIVILYFVTTIIGETAVNGTPFGQRFNKTWGPVRLIIFFALLVPVNVDDQHYGMNTAQMLTFWTAKFGSNFATNAWGHFNESLVETYLGPQETLIATPNAPEINALVRFMFVAKTCKIAEEFAYGETLHAPDGVQGYLVRDEITGANLPGPNVLPLDTVDFAGALDFNDAGNIEIRFGVYNEERYPLDKGAVKAVCGVVNLPVTSNDPDSGAWIMQEIYYELVRAMWDDAQGSVNAACVRGRIMQIDHDPNCNAWPTTNFANNEIQRWTNFVKNQIPAAVAQEAASTNFAVTPELRAMGWGGAAIWYNRIAQQNGQITAAIGNMPFADKYPFLMEHIGQQNKATNENISPEDLFDPALGGRKESDYPRYKDKMIAAVLYNAYTFWDKSGNASKLQSGTSGNTFNDVVNMIFGTEGVFAMRENTDIHPLAQLSVLGKGLMDASVRNIGSGLVGTSLVAIFGKAVGGDEQTLKALINMAVSVGKFTMIISFILYYVLPFLPFIYFMFALSGWIKSIFEAVVAMPLWALAHISRMDGQGMPGPAANNGYFLLLEIFLRPILIVFGLVASLTIFAASVRVLNDVFDLVVSNVSGYDMEAEFKGIGPSSIEYYRLPVDKFFFTMMYAIMVYMMATGFFKLIDQVPNNILRWMGVSVSTFSEAAGDPAGQLIDKVFKGGNIGLGFTKDASKLAALMGTGS